MLVKKKKLTKALNREGAASEKADKSDVANEAAISSLKKLPGLFNDLADEKITLDQLFNKIDPVKFKGKEDYIVRYVTSNARAFAVKKSVDHDLLVSKKTVLASYIYKHYPQARQFFKSHGGVTKLNIEDLTDVWETYTGS